MDSNSKAVIGLTFLSAVALILVYIFNALSSFGSGIFNTSVGNNSRKYGTEITPAGYAFSIWFVIYVWQALWMLYAIVSIFKRNSKGRVIVNPVVLPILFHVFWITSCALLITWLFVWDREQLLASFLVLLFLTLSGYAATAFQSIATARNKERIRKESNRDLILIYVLIQNGTDLLYSWATVATMINLSAFLIHSPLLDPNVSPETAGVISLCVLLALVIGWSLIENTVFFDYFQYVYAWYGVLLWASIAILVKNYDLSNPNTILTFIIMVVAVVCLGMKIVVYFWKTKRNPGSVSGSQTKINLEMA